MTNLSTCVCLGLLVVRSAAREYLLHLWNRHPQNNSHLQPRVLQRKMRGADEQQSQIFSYLSPEPRVRNDHPLRAIWAMVDGVLPNCRVLCNVCQRGPGPQLRCEQNALAAPAATNDKNSKSNTASVSFSAACQRALEFPDSARACPFL
jgi:hypothetical protein